MPTGRFLLRNDGKHAAMLVRRSAPGWGGKQGEASLAADKGEVREKREWRVFG